MKNLHRDSTIAAVLASSLLLTRPALAAYPEWTGGASDLLWGSAGNWSTAVLPTSADEVSINGVPAVEPVRIDSSTAATVKDVRLGYALTGNPAQTGALCGWGSFAWQKKTTICNNGLVIADGRGEGRVFSFDDTGDTSNFDNTVENDSTNGWYAVNGGKLQIAMRSSSLTNSTAYFTWGEAEDDAVIDPVNSARLSFEGLSWSGKYGVTSVTGSIYAADHADLRLQALPGTLVGSWEFSLGNSGACEGLGVEFRYDHIAARGMKLTLWRHDGTGWTKIPDAVCLEGYRITASGLSPSGSNLGLFAVTGQRPGTIFLFK